MNQYLQERQPFPVDQVVPVTDRIWSQRLDQFLAWRFGEPCLAVSNPDRLVANTVAHQMIRRFGKLPRELAAEGNSFIEAVRTAFSQHRPLVISPDSIWLGIAQGFSHHIAGKRRGFALAAGTPWG